MLPRPSPARRRRSRLAAAVVTGVAFALGTSACSPPAPTTQTRATATAADLGLVQVAGAAGDKPSLRVPTPFSVARTQKRVVVPGKGAKVRAGQRVTVDFLGVNGADGHEFSSSFGLKPSSFLLDRNENMPGLVTAVVGSTVGSRLLVAIPPADAYGVQGQPAAGIGPTDTIVVVVDVRSARDVLTRATGTAVAPKRGLPTVKTASGGAPRITLPRTDPPSSLVVQPLIRGRGPAVRKGQQVTVHYTGVVWPGGEVFDSSWRRGKPSSFPIGRGQVVAGWDEGLVGRTVGSRLLLVIPPDKGYGAAGKPEFDIGGTDTLVFVVDVLDAS